MFFLSGKAEPESQLLSAEKAALGFYVTGHPLTKYEKLLNTYATSSAANISSFADGAELSVGGIIEKARFTTTKRKGEKMAIARLEDLDNFVCCACAGPPHLARRRRRRPAVCDRSYRQFRIYERRRQR